MINKNYNYFEGAKKAKTPNALLAILITVAILIIGQSIGMLISTLIDPFIKNSPTLLKLSALLFNGGIIIILLVMVIVRFVEKRSLSTIGFGRKNILGKYLLGFLIGLVMFSSVVLILKLTGHITVNSKSEFPIGMAALTSVLIVLPGWMVQSAAEEVLTRGWLMNVLGGRYNAAVAVIISASLFGILHMFNDNFSIVALINIVLVGAFLGIYIIKNNDLWGACGIHGAWNWAQGNVYGFEVSGKKVGMSTLMNLKPIGPDWFTGGSFGPEAGLASTIVLAIATVIVLTRLSRKKTQ